MTLVKLIASKILVWCSIFWYPFDIHEEKGSYHDPRFRSALVVLVVAAKPESCFVASLGSAVEPLVHSPEPVESACIGGIGVVHNTVLEHERTHARSLAGIRGHVGSGHGRDLRDWTLVVARLPFSSSLPCERLLGRPLAPVVVFNASFVLLLLTEPDIKVKVKVIAKRRCPRERPSHPALIRLQFCERRS